MDNPVSVAELQEFYLEGAAATFASGLEPIQLDLGLKYYQYERGDLVYLDTYSTLGEYSAGQTTIYVDGTPVWVMQYQGWCKDNDPEVIAFLQRALLSAYSQGEFLAGRGPLFYREDLTVPIDRTTNPLTYRNYTSTLGWTFEYFEGHDTIYRHWDGETLFWHRFQGLLLQNVSAQKPAWHPHH